MFPFPILILILVLILVSNDEGDYVKIDVCNKKIVIGLEIFVLRASEREYV
jgi:hypothetical protein